MVSVPGKRVLFSLLVGLFIWAGLLPASPVQAAPPELDAAPAYRQITFSQYARIMNDLFGVEETAVMDYLNAGSSYRDVAAAAFFALAGNKSLDDVMSRKTAANTWREVARFMGLTPKQLRSAYREIVVDQLDEKLGFNRSATALLLEEGYIPYDIAMAGLFARDCGRTTGEVLALKQINNTWWDVAHSLEIPPSVIRADVRLLRESFPWALHRPAWQ